MQERENKFTNDLTPQDLGSEYQNLEVSAEPKQTISSLSKEIYQTNVEKGFWSVSSSVLQKIKAGEPLNQDEITYIENAFTSQRLMLIVSEAAEAMEAIRKGKKQVEMPLLDKFEADGYTPTDSPDSFQYFFEEEVKDSYSDELADVAIRLMDLAEGEGIDIEKHIHLKLAYNKTRSAMHGGKKF